MSKLFFIGDSITTGAWDEKGGWANRLIGQVMEMTMQAGFKEGAFYCMPYNLGVSGDTVVDILPRLADEIQCRIAPEDTHETIQIVYAIGVNDSVYMVEEDRPRFTDEEFRQNLQHLVKLSQQLTKHICFIGLPPVNDDLLNPIPWAPEKAYIAERVNRFENIIGQVCSENNLSFLPLFETWLQLPDWKDYLIDGVHPNSKGHELLAKQIGEFLINEKFKQQHSNL